MLEDVPCTDSSIFMVPAGTAPSALAQPRASCSTGGGGTSLGFLLSKYHCPHLSSHWYGWMFTAIGGVAAAGEDEEEVDGDAVVDDVAEEVADEVTEEDEESVADRDPAVPDTELTTGLAPGV